MVVIPLFLILVSGGVKYLVIVLRYYFVLLFYTRVLL